MTARSQAASITVESIYLSLAHHEWLESGVGSLDSTWHELNDLSRRTLASIASFTAFAEMFMVERMLDAVLTELSTFGSGPERRFQADLRRDIENTFMSRVTLLETWYQLRLRDWPRWSELNGFIEARNSWAHGQGRLTRQQDARQADAQIKSAGMQVVAGTIRCNKETARRCADCTIALVDFLDSSFPTSLWRGRQ